jgi:hypothetical protein
MSEPTAAKKTPFVVDVEAGRSYDRCSGRIEYEAAVLRREPQRQRAYAGQVRRCAVHELVLLRLQAFRGQPAV